MANFDKFAQALRDGDCSVVDNMMSQGYVPVAEELNLVCETGNIDLFDRLSPYIDLQVGLFAAVETQQIHLLDRLFLAGADIHLPDDKGYTILHKVNNPVVCQWLLDMGATHIPDPHGMLPLWNACYKQNLEVVRVIRSHQRKHQPEVYKKTLLEAIKTLKISSAVAIRLIREGNTRDCKRNRFINMLTLLLSIEGEEENICEPDERGKTPLFWACFHRYIDIVKLLLTHVQGMKSISQADFLDQLPISFPLNCGNTEIVKLLLSYEEGERFLHCPYTARMILTVQCLSGRVEMVKILLQCKQVQDIVFQPDGAGETVLDKAKDHPNIVALLQSL